MLSAVLPLYTVGGVELLVFSLLIAPISSLNGIGLALVGVAKSPTGLVVCGTLGLVMVAFLLAGLMGGVETDSLGSLGQGQEAQLMALAAAANLAGGLALGKLAGVMRALERLKLSHAALKKQADGLQLAYKTLHEESDGGAKSKPGESEVDKLKANLAEQREKFSALDKSNEKLGKENDRLAAEKKGSEATAEALKRQATSVMREYERLQTENEGLKSQLTDIDADSIEQKKGS